MAWITQEEFKELLTHKADVSISIFMPTHRAGVEVNEKQDVIRYKNALQAAYNQLQQAGSDQQFIDDLLKAAFELCKDEVFWNNQQEGLAVYVSNDLLKVFKLPYTISEDVFIGRSFCITPLVPVIDNQQHFYLLSLSKHDAIFYRGDAYGISQIDVQGLPNGIEDVIHFEEKEMKQLFRQGGKGGTGSANFHGHGEGQSDDKDSIGVYCQEVDRTLLSEVLHDQTAPLILAGVEYLLPIYRKASHYNYIWDEVITGNQQHEDEQTLFLKAKNLLEPYFEEASTKALERYYNSIATPLTSSMPETVIPASYYARVAEFFVCKDTYIWGTFNESDNLLEIHDGKQVGDENLIDRATGQTLLNGGTVYLLEADRMPKESIIAALLRY